MNLNKAFLIGRLTRDPESRTLPSGQSVSNFGLATNRVWVNPDNHEKQEQTEFHNIVAFGKLADICNQYLVKGSLVLVEGRIQTRSWQDQNGGTKYRTEVVVEKLQMGPKSGQSGQKPATKKEADSNEPVQEEVAEIQIDDEPGEDEVKTEDIPF
jgi:single-strand DNA-binding protein